MPTPPPKSPFRCPACGFVQLEPPHLVSTNCRSCGAHYKASDSTEGLDASSGSQSLAGRKHETGKPVHCLKCGRTHQVSPKAQSTICPGCYAPIELIDVNITAHASRSIDTRGHLKITAKGSVSNPWIICGSARVEGPFQGHLRCEGEARLAMQKTCTGRITAGSLVIDRKAVIDCSQLVDADSVSIEGIFRGRIQCRGIVKVLKGGRLEGPVEAPAIIVEKGGIFVGDCRIAPPSARVANTEAPAVQNVAPLEEDLVD